MEHSPSQHSPLQHSPLQHSQLKQSPLQHFPHNPCTKLRTTFYSVHTLRVLQNGENISYFTCVVFLSTHGGTHKRNIIELRGIPGIVTKNNNCTKRWIIHCKSHLADGLPAAVAQDFLVLAICHVSVTLLREVTSFLFDGHKTAAQWPITKVTRLRRNDQ